MISKFAGNKTRTQKKRILEAIDIATSMGIPLEQYGSNQERRIERIGLVILALGDITPRSRWSDIKDSTHSQPKGTRDIINFVNQHYGESISLASYDDFKRKEIDMLEPDGIIVKTAKGVAKASATNDSRSAYAICPSHASVIRKYGTDGWNSNLESFLKPKKPLRETTQLLYGGWSWAWRVGIFWVGLRLVARHQINSPT